MPDWSRSQRKRHAPTLPVAIMGQAQATHYREYVHARLVKESEKETCTNPTCCYNGSGSGNSLESMCMPDWSRSQRKRHAPTLPVAIMGQAQATHYREYVHA